MGNEQTSLFPTEAKESGCAVCHHFSALKDPRERSDGAVIYGYCFKGGDKNYSTNMGKGLAVFLPDGICKQFKRRRKSPQREEGQE
ncbi:hypothetical protein NE562_11615 [Butyricicoccus faecihominis]|uniref:hypothetical protein n=1 Tax=Butyricicoccus faecihominis TaxID=1712515 RepID=UPI00247A8E23|nr:hypothetical protein [Butyricicoccus faecihominis]MCQ5130310.1 hypothetical protein [Butyricicoccus faecihominis]